MVPERIVVFADMCSWEENLMRLVPRPVPTIAHGSMCFAAERSKLVEDLDIRVANISRATLRTDRRQAKEAVACVRAAASRMQGSECETS